MAANPLIAFRASPEIKAALHSLAQQRNLSDSAFLQRLVELVVQNSGITNAQPVAPVEPVARGARLYVRLRPEDHVLLRERADSRGMASATYGSMVLRAHLRGVAPLPDREFSELKRAIGELGMIGRNLNQIARVANQTGNLAGPTPEDLRAVLRALKGLRDHVKSLMLANTKSWESGSAEATR
ncbi:MAG: plasmid mobilization relaxosome protein MobC [Proteobacteria bacterium]|nr:plasmid mobilization relaxosome protein MobC [Pseudomonadota bacterium]